MSKQFHIGDILSITTGKLVSLNHMTGVYNILDYMFNSSHYTHELPTARQMAIPYLLKQFPQIAEETGENVNIDNWKDYLTEMEAKYGSFFEVNQVQEGV